MTVKSALKVQLLKHEGLKLRPYRDSLGKLTIGVGRNLEENGISENEALYLLDNDVEHVIEEASRFLWYEKLSSTRKVVVLNMIFNLGLPKFKQFKHMIAALEEGNYSEAAMHMMDSLWAKQVGGRAEDLARMMRDDGLPDVG